VASSVQRLEPAIFVILFAQLLKNPPFVHVSVSVLTVNIDTDNSFPVYLLHTKYFLSSFLEVILVDTGGINPDILCLKMRVVHLGTMFEDLSVIVESEDQIFRGVKVVTISHDSYGLYGVTPDVRKGPKCWR
jgi:hypothetical protein